MTRDAPKTVLLVDDDPLIIRMYQRKLSDEGYQVILAFDGSAAVIEAKQNKPNVILLDLMMPKLNGVEVLKLLKADEETKAIPVIVLTNLGDHSDERIRRAKEIGALEYLVKSEVSLTTLVERIRAATG